MKHLFRAYKLNYNHKIKLKKEQTKNALRKPSLNKDTQEQKSENNHIQNIQNYVHGIYIFKINIIFIYTENNNFIFTDMYNQSFFQPCTNM